MLAAQVQELMSERPAVGSIVAFPGDWTDDPRGTWLLCDGAELSVARYSELFKVIQNRYGSVQADHFKLPDLRFQFLRGANTGADVGHWEDLSTAKPKNRDFWPRPRASPQASHSATQITQARSRGFCTGPTRERMTW